MRGCGSSAAVACPGATSAASTFASSHGRRCPSGAGLACTPGPAAAARATSGRAWVGGSRCSRASGRFLGSSASHSVPSCGIVAPKASAESAGSTSRLAGSLICGRVPSRSMRPSGCAAAACSRGTTGWYAFAGPRLMTRKNRESLSLFRPRTRSCGGTPSRCIGWACPSRVPATYSRC